MSTNSKLLLSGKHIPRFELFQSLAFPLKLSSSVQIPLCGFACEREES